MEGKFMQSKYDEFKEKNQKRINEFPMKLAFSDEQFKKAMDELGLTVCDTDKILFIGGGGFIRKTDLKDFYKLWRDIRNEHNLLIKNDKTGEGYIKDMFVSELNNHEYSYTHDITATLEALELNCEDVINSPTLKHGLELALKDINDDIEYEL